MDKNAKQIFDMRAWAWQVHPFSIENFLDYENIIVHEYKYNSITEKYKPTIHA